MVIMSVSIVPHAPSWRKRFADEAPRIRQALGANVVAVHHVGSTSIPGILAKPIIDIVVEVTRIDDVSERADRMSCLDYESLGEHGIEGRRYFRRAGTDGQRAFHVHVFESGSAPVLEHIAFRDYLRAHPDKAREYSALKSRLIADGVNRAEYQSLKAPFLEASIRDAMEWSRARASQP